MTRAAVSRSASPMELASMPLSLPTPHAAGRPAVVALAEHGIVLAHNVAYFLHVCAQDWMNHTECSAPFEFLVDLTPPVCDTPLDVIGGQPAPTYFSTRAGYAATWRCTDAESGVVYTEWMAYASERPLLAQGVVLTGATGRQGLTIPYEDGLRFMSCVGATNGAGLAVSQEDSCSVGTTFDGSPPVTQGLLLRDGSGSAFQQSPVGLWCTHIPATIDDPTSGVLAFIIELFEQVCSVLGTPGPRPGPPLPCIVSP